MSLNALVFTIAVAIVGFSPSPVAAAEVPEVFVAPDGDDAAQGSKQQPLASLARARDLLRGEIGESKVRGTVWLAGGTYELDETLVLDRRDSGLKFRARPGQVPVVSGASKLPTEWRRSGDGEGIWEIDVPADFGEVRTVFRKGISLPRARTVGFRQLAKVPADVPYRIRRQIDGRHLYLPMEALDLVSDFAHAEVRVIGRFPWLMNLQPVESVDPRSGLLKTEVEGIYPLTAPAFGRFPEGTLWIENVPEAMDRDGEWIFDQEEKRLSMRSEKKPVGITVARMTELVRIEGEQDPWDYIDRPVTGVEFNGVTFAHAKRYAWPVDKIGWGLQHDWEMYDRATAMVRLRFAEDCRFEDCRFIDSGAAGLRMDLHAQRNAVRHSEFVRLGGVGVLLAGYGMGWKDVNRDNVIADCRFHDLGREWWASPAVFVWQSGGNKVVHNDIFDLPYSGIVVSGRTQLNVSGLKESSRTARWDEVINHLENGDRSWQAREPLMHGRNNVIGWNEISDVMKVLADGNAIYVSGTGGGNRVVQNFVHDIDSPNINAAIRMDDDQYGVEISGNVVARCTGEGLVLKGRNDVTGNLFYGLRSRTGEGANVLFQRGYLVLSGEPVAGADISGNAFVSLQEGQAALMEYAQEWKKGPRMMPPVTLASAGSERNLWWCSVDPAWGERLIEVQQKVGAELGSVAMDPQLMAPENDDFRLRPDASAEVRAILGEGWNVESAGVRPRSVR